MIVSIRSYLIQAALGAILSAAALVPAAQAQPSLRFSLPAQPLADALRAVATQASLNVVFDPPVVADRMAPALQAQLTTTEVLSKLLAGTGLEFEFVSERTVAIRPAGPDNAKAASSDPGRLHLARGENQSDTPKAESKSPDSKDVSEIIVTAQKRSERLQDVPVPVTTISADTLTTSNQLRLQDYYTRIPGLNVILGGDQGAPRVAIRGITTGGSTNPTVATMIDDIPLGASTTAGLGQVAPDIDPSDVGSIEVLRGPQGTLYGASSLGGLIKYVTIDPSTESVSGRAQLGISSPKNGDGVGYNARGSVNVPLSDTWAVRASAFTRRDAGYIDNVQTGEDGINSIDSEGGRLSALWRPSDVFSLKLAALYQHARGDGTSEIHLLPGLGDLQQSALRGSGWFDKKIQAYSAVIGAQLGRFELTSLSGYSIYQVASNLDGTPAVSSLANTAFGVTGVVSAVGPLKTTKFTQEVRLSTALGERIGWLFGAFYTDEDVPRVQDIYAANAASGLRAGSLLSTQGRATFKDYAVFTNLTFDITDRFDIQVGGRASENKQTDGPQTEVGPWNTILLRLPSLTVVKPQFVSKDESFTYLVTPRFKVSPNLMAYARFASGYRPGGPNTSVVGVVGLLPEFSADTTQNYEIGIKGDLLDRTLSFDASLYYIDWKDMQLQLRNANFQAYFDNAGRAKSQGVELSMQSRPLTGLTIAGWVAWNDAELTESFPSTSTAIGVSGDRLPYSSHFSGNLSIDQEFPLLSSALGFIGGSVSYIGDRKGVFRSSPLRETFPAYAQVDLRGGVRYDAWTVEAFVNNVADKRGVIRGGFDAPFATYPSFNYTQPRTVGIALSRTF